MPAHDHLGFGLVVGGGRDADRVAVPEIAPQPLVEKLRLLAISALAERRMRTVER